MRVPLGDLGVRRTLAATYGPKEEDMRAPYVLALMFISVALGISVSYFMSTDLVRAISSLGLSFLGIGILVATLFIERHE